MARNRVVSGIKALFNIIKKFVDILDDLWSTLRGTLPVGIIRAVTPYILGGVGLVTHLGEGIIGAKRAYRTFKNKKIGQRNTRLFSSLLITLAAGSGLGLSLSLIASTLGAAVSATTLVLAPALIPGLLTVIYSLSLWRKGYVFYKAREKEEQARQEYDELRAQPGFSLEEREAINEKKKIHENCREKRLQAERKLAFNIVEVLASAMVVTSTIIGTAAIIGASVASFGALPMALLIIGVTVGVSCKILENYDANHHFNFSRRLRNWFGKCGDKPGKGEDLFLQPQSQKTSCNSSLYKKMAELHLIEMVSLRGSEASKQASLSTEAFPQKQKAFGAVPAMMQEECAAPSLQPGFRKVF